MYTKNQTRGQKTIFIMICCFIYFFLIINMALAEGHNELAVAPSEVGSSTNNLSTSTEVVAEDKKPGRQILAPELREGRQLLLTEAKQKRILNLSANISNRMDAVTVRLYTIIERLEQRISKLKQAGYTTTEAEVSLRSASQNLATAKTRLSQIDALVYNATTSNESQKSWQGVRVHYQETGQLIRQSHEELKTSLSHLKSAIQNKDSGIQSEIAPEPVIDRMPIEATL